MQHKQLLQDETLAKKLITKGFWSYFFALIVAPIGYLLRMFLSNTVSVAEVGIFYSVLGLMGLIATYNDLGLTEAMQYFIPKFRIKNEKAKVRLVIVASFLMQMVTGILIFCLLYFGAEWLAIHHFHDMVAKQILQILAFYFFGMNIITLCSTMFVSFQDTFSQGIVQSVQQVVNLVFTVVFWAMASLTIVSYAWVWIIGTLTAILVGVGIVIGKYRHVFIREAGESSLFSLENSAHPWKIPPPPLPRSSNGAQYERGKRKGVLKQHFKYALWVFLAANVSVLLGNVDQQVVVNVLGAESAGLFSNFQALILVFTMVVTPLLGLLFPITTELITKQDTKKFWLLQRIMYTYFGAFALMIAGFFVVRWPEISVFLFGEQFRFSGYMLQWAAPALVFNCRAVISLNILAGLGQIKQRLGVVGVALGVNLLLNLIFLIILKQGLVYSAVILSLSWAVMAFGAMWVIYRMYAFTLDWKFLIKNVVVVLVLCGVMWVLKGFAPVGGRWELFLWLLVFFVGYGVVLVVLNWKRVSFFLTEIRNLKKK